jgi:signal transduction histidine kinase
MASTRARLTVSYAFVLLGTMVVFAASIWAARRNVAPERLGQELGPLAFRLADRVLSSVQSAQLDGKRLTYVDSSDVANPAIRSTKDLSEVLDPIGGFFMVLDQRGRTLYSSLQMRFLPPDDQTKVLQNALTITDEGFGITVPVRGDSMVLLAVVRRNSGASSNISRVLAAVPSSVTEVPVNLLVGTMVALAPIIFVVSLIVAYLVVGNAFSPIDKLINEVEAITDGRSLHRRLPTDSSNDELARLSLTVNAMLARLESSFSALRRFTADASHELKTPLTVLRADVERAMHPATHRAEKMVALEEALQETARMSDLVDSLLTLARADEGRFDIFPVAIELEPLVREVYETAVILGEYAGLTLSMPTLENAVVMGDRTRLRQLLLNLVTNAIKYTPRGGRVEVSVTRRAGDEISISVRDTGIGISATDLPHVFDRFWRADRARSRATERGGFGLGLSISQWIVQAHGGTITVASRLGRGTIFTVVLPTAKEPEASTESAVSEVGATEAADG